MPHLPLVSQAVPRSFPPTARRILQLSFLGPLLLAAVDLPADLPGSSIRHTSDVSRRTRPRSDPRTWLPLLQTVAIQTYLAGTPFACQPRHPAAREASVSRSEDRHIEWRSFAC